MSTAGQAFLSALFVQKSPMTPSEHFSHKDYNNNCVAARNSGSETSALVTRSLEN